MVYSHSWSWWGSIGVGDFEHHQPAMAAQILNGFCRTSRTLPQRLLTAITSPTLLPIYKAAVGDPGISPDSIKQFFDDGPRAVTDGLAHMLRSAATREEIFVNDCAIAAQQFVGMVRANIQLEVALGLRPAPPPDEIRHVVDQAVEIFLRGIQCKCPPPRPQAATVQRGRR
jgi:hypothetical protein